MVEIKSNQINVHNESNEICTQAHSIQEKIRLLLPFFDNFQFSIEKRKGFPVKHLIFDTFPCCLPSFQTEWKKGIVPYLFNGSTNAILFN